MKSDILFKTLVFLYLSTIVRGIVVLLAFIQDLPQKQDAADGFYKTIEQCDTVLKMYHTTVNNGE